MIAGTLGVPRGGAWRGCCVNVRVEVAWRAVADDLGLRFMHFGGPVADVEAAMAQYTALGAGPWALSQPTELSTWDGERGRVVRSVLRIAFGRLPGGGVVELVQPVGGEPDAPQFRMLLARPGLNHTGYWCPDVPATAERLIALGASLLTATAPAGVEWRPGGDGVADILPLLTVAHLRMPTGDVCELVSESLWPDALERLMGPELRAVLEDPRLSRG